MCASISRSVTETEGGSSDQALKDQRHRLNKHIQQLLWRIFELESTINEYEGDLQQLVFERITRILGDLDELQTLSDQPICEARFPVELLNFVNDGGNPDVYTTEVFKTALRNNQISKGKVQSLRLLRDNLLTRAEEAHPEEAAEYRAAVAAATKPEEPTDEMDVSAAETPQAKGKSLEQSP